VDIYFFLDTNEGKKGVKERNGMKHVDEKARSAELREIPLPKKNLTHKNCKGVPKPRCHDFDVSCQAPSFSIQVDSSGGDTRN
jgi:hypothetical protein